LDFIFFTPEFTPGLKSAVPAGTNFDVPLIMKLWLPVALITKKNIQEDFTLDTYNGNALAVYRSGNPKRSFKFST